MKRVLKSPTVLRTIGRTVAAYFKFVAVTSRAQNPMQPFFDEVAADEPAIFTFWHGEQFLIPTAIAKKIDLACLVSRHGDGEMQAAALESYGLKTIRGSGGKNRAKTLKKGGVQSSLEILSALEEGMNIAMTANVPKGPAREVGKGVVTLGKLSGRPIFPVTMVSSKNIYLKSWDQTAINLPFSKVAFKMGKPVRVSASAGELELETARLSVEKQLLEITKQANNLVGAARAIEMME
ncbi:MAG: lysophospholipid acyltransferase family protein [Hyphomicrobiales bacterium]